MASAIIAIDSVSPTCRTLPSSTLAWNWAAVRPQPIFCWNGRRRDRASWIRLTVMAWTSSQTPVSVIGSASIVKPGFTPVPSTATFAFFAAASMIFARRFCEYAGYASSSVVETIGTRSLSTPSICGQTFFNDELVHSTTTSGLVALIAARASGDTFTRSV